jgi:ABC-2 type transport system permease protein
MGGLLKAEFRKTITTGLWWGLLIPTVLLALGWSLATGAIGKALMDAVASEDVRALTTILGIDPSQWKVGVFAIARSINVATIFPMVFGCLAISNEISKKTITTTFLTAPNRFSALSAKMLIYVLWGFIYGVVIVGMVSLGVAIAGNSAQLPDAQGWLALAGAGVILSILMTLLGVGVGALIPSVIGSIVSLLLYMLLVENGLLLVTTGNVPWLGGALPNGSADGLTGSVATNVFLGTAGSVPPKLETVIRVVAGALGAFDWWLSGLIFLGWTLVFFAGGWALTQRKDIT